MSDLQKTIEEVQLRVNSPENRRRLELQTALQTADSEPDGSGVLRSMKVVQGET